MEFQEFKNLVTRKAEAMGLTHYELYYQAEASTSAIIPIAIQISTEAYPDNPSRSSS